jgi:hypothetical protein
VPALSRNVLRLSRSDPLVHAHYLGDYEAILVDLDWASLLGLRDAPDPGEVSEVTVGFVRDIKEKLEERSAQLDQFLKAGGVLVAKVKPISVMWAPHQYVPNQPESVSTTRWIEAQVPHLLYAALAGPSFETGSGHEIVVRETGHPFENVLSDAAGYDARISAKLFQVEGTVLLATTRIGDPVAAEMPVDRGVVFLLPSGVDDDQLLQALDDILATRQRHRQNWLLPEEAALIEAEKVLLEATRERRVQLVDRGKSLNELRESVMKDVDVRRAISYYENGVSATRAIKQAMYDLYKLVELLEDNLGGSEDVLASTLGVQKTDFKRIKKLANQRKLDFRHAKSGETEGADVAEIDQAREDARVLVQKFIEHRCNEEMLRRAAESSRVKTT